MYIGKPGDFHFKKIIQWILLIHQDYADHSRKAVIKFFRDGIQLWNPGDVFGDDRHLLQPGEKEVRNPGLAGAMRRIIMCEQAGTGLRMMREQWKQLGHPEPKINNDRSWKAFEFFLPGLEVDLGGTSKLLRSVTGEVTGEVIRLLNVISGEMKRSEIQKLFGLKHDEHFRISYLLPALKMGLIELTVPDKPNSRLQRYRISKIGKEFLKKSK
jgi:ATP-dependent DNA helicase RecG